MTDEPISFVEMLPDAPSYEQADLERCRASGDYRKVLFEHYVFVTQLLVLCANITFESPAWSGRSRKTWEVLAGLFTRCHRLMAANLEFFQDDRYGEATQIIDRCIFESASKIRWIATDKGDERLIRYLEGSLKPDVEFEAQIMANIASRGGEETVIEKRMLASIKRHRELAGLGEVDPRTFRRLPDLASILDQIGEDRIGYTVIGKIASHHVHGAWGSLITAYLEEDDSGQLRLRAEALPSHVNQYILLPAFVLNSAISYVSSCFEKNDANDYIICVLRQAIDDIVEMDDEVVGGDFDVA